MRGSWSDDDDDSLTSVLNEIAIVTAIWTDVVWGIVSVIAGAISQEFVDDDDDRSYLNEAVIVHGNDRSYEMIDETTLESMATTVACIDKIHRVDSMIAAFESYPLMGRIDWLLEWNDPLQTLKVWVEEAEAY